MPPQNLCLARYEFALDRLRALKAVLPSNIVFDLGPGDARMRKIEDEGFLWHGFDLTAWRDIVRWDLTDPCPNNDVSAGAVLLLDVIEHCANPGLALRNIGAVMMTTGRLIITTPNPRWSGSRFHTFVFGTASGFTQQDLDENHHVFTPWPHILEKMLHDAGFEIDEYVTLDGKARLFSRPGTLFLPARYLLNVGLMAMEWLDPSSCGMSYGLVARKVARSGLAP